MLSEYYINPNLILHRNRRFVNRLAGRSACAKSFSLLQPMRILLSVHCRKFLRRIYEDRSAKQMKKM